MKCVMGLALVSGGAMASQLRGQEDRYASFQTAVVEGPSYDSGYYSAQCDKINDECEERKAQRIREYERDLAELKEEYQNQANVLSEKEAHHKNEKADVPPQAKKVAAEQKDVAEAKKAVEAKAHCPADLQVAESRLDVLVAQPDKTAADIDEECKLKKKILELKACVAEFRAAELVLAKETDQYDDENGELKDESAQESKAASAVPPQKAKTADAKNAYEAFKARGVRGLVEIEEECEADRNALERKADDNIAELENWYSGEKSTLGEKVNFHKDEQADVAPQKERVTREQKDVADAKEAVKEHEHCPPELAEAKRTLSGMESRLDVLQGKPNKTPEDVDEECELKKKILEQKAKIQKLEACVEKLKAAQAVLAKETMQYHDENTVLSKERTEEGEAASAVPPQKRVVAGAERSLAAAKEARKSICHGTEKKKPAPPAPPAKEKSAAHRAAATTTVLAVFAVLFSTMQA